MASKHIFIIGIVLVYLILRLTNLTVLPIFNDEAIYLDWGWREITIPGNLFYSLYDAKQPLLMWFFGISMKIFSDALFAGRIVSVLTGLITLLGLYVLGRDVFSKKVGSYAAILYTIVPLFSFFDRQVLMESALGAVGIWSLYFIVKITQDIQKISYQVLLGLVLGIGILIKTSGVLFVLAAVALLGSVVKSSRINLKNRIVILSRTLGVILASLSILLIQTQFWSTLGTNDRYSLTLSELVKFPILHFLSNIRITSEIMFVLLSPLVIISLLHGIYVLWKKNENNGRLVIVWFVVLLLLQSLFVRNNSQRYLVSFLPIITIFVGYSLVTLVTQYTKLRAVLPAMIFFVPLVVTIIQILSPVAYFTNLAKISRYSDKHVYMESQTSGYGIAEVNDFLNSEAQDKKIYVTTAVNTGNPESAMRAYFAGNNNVDVVYFDGQMFDKQLYDYECLKTDRTLFFVSRDEQQAGLNTFFMLVKHIPNPHGENRIGIYTLKKPCTGKVLPIDMQTLITYEK